MNPTCNKRKRHPIHTFIRDETTLTKKQKMNGKVTAIHQRAHCSITRKLKAAYIPPPIGVLQQRRVAVKLTQSLSYSRLLLPRTKHSSNTLGVLKHRSWYAFISNVYWQEESRALHQALFPDGGGSTKKPDCRRAECSMDNLNGLESALWEAHGREARAAALLETRNLRVRTRTHAGGANTCLALRPCL